MSGGAVIIDVRTWDEYESGHIFEQKINELDKTKHYALYCRSGNRSANAMALMSKIGFDAVVDLKGGIKEWVANGNTLSCEGATLCRIN